MLHLRTKDDDKKLGLRVRARDKAFRVKAEDTKPKIKDEGKRSTSSQLNSRHVFGKGKQKTKNKTMKP